MRKFFRVIFFVLLFTLILNQSFAEQGNFSPVLSSKNIVSQVSKEGKDTKGITFVTHDIYYDGYLLLFNATMLPNEDGFCVVNDVLGNYESFSTETIPSDLSPIGAYFEMSITDQEGQNIGNPLLGKVENKDNAVTRTFAYSFPLDGKKTEIVTNVSYGVMEKPGILVGDTLDTFTMVIPKQKEAVLNEVELEKLPEELSYIKQIAVAQSDEMASVYMYFVPTRNTEFPVAFLRDGSSLEISTSNKDYIQEAFRTDNLESFRIIDSLTSKVYEVDIKQGTFTLLDTK